jgi:hypothetical protein
LTANATRSKLKIGTEIYDRTDRSLTASRGKSGRTKHQKEK